MAHMDWNEHREEKANNIRIIYIVNDMLKMHNHGTPSVL
jgi:hypothetical protein